MIAIQKPPNFSIANVHHRHPSAPPAVVVQPTRTPGLLSLSKPAQRPQRPRQTQWPKQASSPKPAPVAAAVVPALKPAAEIVEKKGPSPSRGRQHSKAKDKQNRSASHSSVRSRRNINRQPSPPTLPSSQAEVPTTPTLDPVMDRIVRAAPKLSARPSGKLARRRQPNIVPFELPTPSKAIPVPKRNNSFSVPLSRSDPFLSHTPPRKSKSRKPFDGFPICDDMTDAGDLSELDISPPVTPTPMRAKRYDDGPRTAPLTTSTVAFPFTSPPSPLAHKNGRRHKRTPSEGVFTMSSDEDRHSPDWSTPSKALFTSTSTSTSREEDLERQAAALAAAYFASSTFQNSPSPDELPPPAF